jgi:integrase
MPAYSFSGDVLLPYMRETETDRKMRTRERESQIAKLLLRFFTDSPISYGKRGKLDGSMVRRYREQRKLTVKPETVKRELALASRACAYAISEWDYMMPNPFSGRLISNRDRRAAPPKTWHVLTRTEEARLLLAARPLCRDIVEFALATGFRQGEILGLKWAQVDGDLVHFTPEMQKANRHGVRALSETALAILARQPDAEYVFHENGKPIRRERFHHQMWAPARKTVGLERFQFHWLRKTCGQRLLEATGSIAVVQHQLGHAESRTTERAYTREPIELVREALRSVDNYAK